MKISLGIIIAVLCVVSVASAGQFGPPEPMSDPGKFSLGLGRWVDQSKVSLGNDYLGVGTLRERSSQLYLQGNYTLMKDWEVYGRLGGATLRIDNDLVDFKDGMQPYGTLGFKGLAYRYKKFAIGPFIEGSLYGGHDDNFDGVNMSVRNQWDLNLGISAQYKIPVGGCDITVYGGPFAYWNRGSATIASPGVYLAQDIQENNNVGGFLGVKFPIIKQKLFFTAEGQLRDRVGAGASISYAF